MSFNYDFYKVKSVLVSCKTMEQVTVAGKMCNLFQKKHITSHVYPYSRLAYFHELNNMIAEKTKFIHEQARSN